MFNVTGNATSRSAAFVDEVKSDAATKISIFLSNSFVISANGARDNLAACRLYVYKYRD